MAKIIITPKGLGLGASLKEMVEYKDLFVTFALRDFKVKYAQTFLGFFWAFIQQILTVVVFTAIKNAFFESQTDSTPSSLYVMAGVTAWTYFDFVLNQSGSSIITSGGMLKKIYFPRLILPLSKALVGLVDFGIAFVLLVSLFVYYGMMPSAQVVFLPFFILTTVLSSLGLGIWISALTIRYRDFQQMVPFALKIGMFVTPIYFSSSVLLSTIDPKYATLSKILYYLNPMAGNVEGFKWALFGGGHLPTEVFLSVGVSLVVFVTSILYFKKAERSLADMV